MNTNKYYDMGKNIEYPNSDLRTKNRELWKEKKQKYNEEMDKIHKLFKQEALEEAGLDEHPKKDILFDFAWEKGHSSGYGDVYCELCDVAELIKKLR